MIRLTKVNKVYRTRWYRPGLRVAALSEIDLQVEPGSALGIVGLNGAGKSTLLRLLLGYIRPTSGEVQIGGMPPRRYVERHGIAYVPEKPTIPPHRSVREAVRAYALLSNLPDEQWGQVDHAIDRVGLAAASDRPVGTLSKGNLQRVAIAQALLGDRQIMILDEPTDGLDPLWIAQLREMVDEWRKADPRRILLLASHNLPEVNRLTDRSILLHNGRYQGPIDPAPSAGEYELRFLRSVEGLEEARS